MGASDILYPPLLQHMIFLEQSASQSKVMKRCHVAPAAHVSPFRPGCLVNDRSLLQNGDGSVSISQHLLGTEGEMMIRIKPITDGTDSWNKGG
jgi:hypothetical protein